MSWFDTSNIVSLAKSTLKEAQKTIDKALDITEDDAEDKALKKSSGRFYASLGSFMSVPILLFSPKYSI